MKVQDRADVALRDRYRCVRCGKEATSGVFSVHHRKLRSQGGTDERHNLILLCGDGTTGCHALVHSYRELIGEPGGYIVPSWADPAEIPVHYYKHGPRLLGDPR